VFRHGRQVAHSNRSRRPAPHPLLSPGAATSIPDAIPGKKWESLKIWKFGEGGDSIRQFFGTSGRTLTPEKWC